MADLESVLADVSFLLAVDRSRDQPAARVSRKIVLPDASIHCVMHKYLTERNETSFEKVFDQKIGSRFYLDFCSKEDFTPPLFHSEILEFERLKVKEDRLAKAKEIFDKYIMSGLLVREHVSCMEWHCSSCLLLQCVTAGVAVVELFERGVGGSTRRTSTPL
eukprot:m.58617 g.58617  ORF g.58617 m.58617 type:complete len:162 (+) comp34819_c0_seq20:76-561(+)